MESEQNKSIEKIRMETGFLFSYLLFTTLLFGIFLFLNKLNELNYFHILGITLLMTILGFIINRLLQ